MNNKTAGIYLHIPFCKIKCIYCDFYSITKKEDQIPRLQAKRMFGAQGMLEAEGNKLEAYSPQLVHTIYGSLNEAPEIKRL